MLNISQQTIKGKIKLSAYRSFAMVKDYRAGKIFSRLLMISLGLLIVIMFLPWTQNIRSKGYVTTLRPDQRPQTINSVIAGRIEKWYVQEGDFVATGDTVMFISEIKDEYFDPDLLSRTDLQITAKEQSVISYKEKVKALDSQIEALKQTKTLKIEQAVNYFRQAQLQTISDSINLEAAKTNLKIAERQLDRMVQLNKDGLKSLTDLEIKKLKRQETEAKQISASNKLLSSRNKLINAKIELASVENQYIDKLSKAESDKYTALSKRFDAEASLTKMRNQYTNYSVRKGFHYVTAQQPGYITTAIRSGLGETIKEGEELVTIMPEKYDLAVTMYVKAMDLPLISKGQPIRFMFDGWPTIVFSGWPNLSYGTFGGKVVAIDNFSDANGRYRILVAPDSSDEEWPDGLRVGSGANAMVLLKDVKIWYELWRNLNGFPPDYYKTAQKNAKATDKK